MSSTGGRSAAQRSGPWWESCLHPKGTGLNDEINNLTNEHHMYNPKGEFVPNGSFNGLQTYSYAGPGTKFVQRVREGYKGVNELDRATKLHDLYYYLYKDVPGRNKADEILADDCRKILAEYPNDIESYPDDIRQLLRDTRVVLYVMIPKSRLGW